MYTITTVIIYCTKNNNHTGLQILQSIEDNFEGSREELYFSLSTRTAYENKMKAMQQPTTAAFTPNISSTSNATEDHYTDDYMQQYVEEGAQRRIFQTRKKYLQGLSDSRFGVMLPGLGYDCFRYMV